MIDTLSEADRRAAIEALNRVLEVELAGVVRYTHWTPRKTPPSPASDKILLS